MHDGKLLQCDSKSYIPRHAETRHLRLCLVNARNVTHLERHASDGHVVLLDTICVILQGTGTPRVLISRRTFTIIPSRTLRIRLVHTLLPILRTVNVRKTFQPVTVQWRMYNLIITKRFPLDADLSDEVIALLRRPSRCGRHNQELTIETRELFTQPRVDLLRRMCRS